MRERDLAMLLIQMGVDSGVDVERAAEELAGVSLPTFVDVRRFKTALIDEVENRMRAQMEQRLQQMRRRLEVDGTEAPVRSSARSSVKPEPVLPPMPQPPAYGAPQPTEIAAPRKGVAEAAPQLADVTQLEGGQVVPSTAEEEDMPTDATMVWTTRHG
jgi:hypothetical protein